MEFKIVLLLCIYGISIVYSKKCLSNVNAIVNNKENFENRRRLFSSIALPISKPVITPVINKNRISNNQKPIATTAGLPASKNTGNGKSYFGVNYDNGRPSLRPNLRSGRGFSHSMSISDSSPNDFVKDPNRQNLAETLRLEYGIDNIPISEKSSPDFEKEENDITSTDAKADKDARNYIPQEEQVPKESRTGSNEETGESDQKKKRYDLNKLYDIFEPAFNTILNNKWLFIFVTVIVLSPWSTFAIFCSALLVKFFNPNAQSKVLKSMFDKKKKKKDDDNDDKVNVSDTNVKGAKILLYSRAGCKYCQQAKEFLDGEGLFYEIVDLGTEPDRLAEIEKITGGMTTVPVCLVNGYCIGGASELKDLKREDLIEFMTRKPGELNYLKPSPIIANRSFMDSLLKYMPSETLLSRANEIRNIYETKMFAANKDTPLNSIITPYVESGIPVLELSKSLREAMLHLCDKFFDDGLIDYNAMTNSDEWYQFLVLAVEFRNCSDLADLSRDERKALFINLYNVMTFHGIASYGRSNSYWHLYVFFKTPVVSYDIGGVSLCLDEIENGILRGIGKKAFLSHDKLELEKKIELSKGFSPTDPRVHAVLNCGAKSCPPVAVFHQKNLEVALCSGMSAFANDSGNVLIDTDNSTVSLNQIFKWYREDFSQIAVRNDEVALLKYIHQYNTNVPVTKDVTIKWLPYDWNVNSKEKIKSNTDIYNFFKAANFLNLKFKFKK